MRPPVYWRRRWCLWRKHPIADWAPVCYSETIPLDYFGGDFPPGMTLEVKQYRCARHDRRSK